MPAWLLTGGVAPVLARRSGDVQEDGWVPPVEPTQAVV